MQNHIYGYARVSTQQQDLIRQLDLLKTCNCTEILTEKISGTKKDRPELMRLKDKIRTGDTLIVESFSRLGRSTKDLIELVEYFEQKGVKLISLKENFDTQTPQGKLMLTVFQAFSQFERDLIVQRTKEGLESARARGRKGGRPKVKEKYIEKALNLYASKEYSISEIVAMSGISQATLYRYIKETGIRDKVQPIEKEKIAKIRMWLRIENNNKFVRGKSKVRKEVEQYLRYDFNMEMNSSNEYVFFVPYKDIDNLTKQVEDIICEIANTADWRNCFIEADTYCDELDLYW
ncbi:recombinase family protein [Bacillus thuringiensis]|uniref:DNA-invertase from lambdoid prophage e14 n=2 Tax=Bacillus thuringiensis TaxID=1428 RepID=A0A9W3SUF6_BACTU|nr:recombinase family protein [Bacillus thuringiensis]AOM11384.1 DNA-invertase from lambdoid prophage e14 [Bacillus thuringiensis Bt18247]AOM14382.1 DNA-invertase from lambdoid prophage e14 [Bacillus thuringiensis Bt18247]AOM14472.1 DNA-invertase from lambdoid prophage e14 [Bacillus thuringiensis Bt18247]AOM14574.1 DNA-invertase from lambdoid prophage e14 [Bacillus thuringiensis Bt18247]AOM14658.1 DNA-invertase from lambdoid prophage e14 [Bacillus thuringiensis Bt18247]